jgi:drug/metabolite transporter (DMT)-like permease
MKNKFAVFGICLLFLSTIVWGLGFPMQEVALKYIGAFSLGVVRNLLAGAVLIPIILLFHRKTERRLFSRPEGRFHLDVRRVEWMGGVSCGIILAIASTLQQLGMTGEETDSGKAAFITALYVVIVPIIGLFRGKRPAKIVWLCIFIAVIGFYLLSASIVVTEPGIGGFLAALKRSGFRFAFSDLLVFLCAVVYSVHVVVIDRFSPDCDGVRLSCIQFFTAGIVLIPFMLIFEQPSIDGMISAALPTLYLAVFSSGVGYTGQIVGQKYVDVTVSAIILSLESVFGAVFGAMFLGETKTPWQIVGCITVFLAVILAQLPSRSRCGTKNVSKGEKL